MSTPFLGEIKIISWNFAPKGWAFCNGQLLPINQNQALFSLMGTMYGGNGQTTFALPDLRGRAPVHVGQSLNVQGQTGGQASHTLTQQEMPQHFHFLNGTTNAAVNTPANTTVLGKSSPQSVYGGPANLATQDPRSISNVGGSQPHENRMPLLALNFIVALIGIFPSRN
jgi:microcystin-dependent protein